MNTLRRHLALAPLLSALPALAQATLPLIAWVWPGSASGELARSSAFKEGMREQGLIEGQHYLLDERYADGHYERFAALTDELLARKPSILMVNTIASVRVAQQATRTLPIIFVATNDPVGSGLIASYARPGGNSTGLSTQNEDVVVKHLQLLRELLPRARRVAVLVNPGNSSGPKLFEQVRSAALAMGIEATACNASSPDDLGAALDAVARLRPDALLQMPDAMFFSVRERIAAFGVNNRIALIGTARETVVAGGLLGYGFVQAEQFRRAAIYVKRILAGAKPAEMPVEQPTRFNMIVNLKTARALGITVPQSLLLRADEVIE